MNRLARVRFGTRVSSLSVSSSSPFSSFSSSFVSFCSRAPTPTSTPSPSLSSIGRGLAPGVRSFSTKAELFTHPSSVHHHRRAPVLSTRAVLLENRNRVAAGSTVGFVPTMGALHMGHIQLVKQSKKENEFTYVSIFVNPSQFLPHEDLSKYPRQLLQDLDLLATHTPGVHAVFSPTIEEMYPGGSGNQSVWVDFEGADTGSAEGKIRPGHFRGVCTVVAKLLNLVRPTHAYFGQKDGMQCIVLNALIRDLCFPTTIRIVNTVRESDGLAMSSRNVYLTPTERARAIVLFHSLRTAQTAFVNEQSSTPTQMKQVVEAVLSKEPLASIQYISVASLLNGQEIEPQDSKLDFNHEYMLSIAVKVGNVRLIDNCILSKDKSRHI